MIFPVRNTGSAFGRLIFCVVALSTVFPSKFYCSAFWTIPSGGSQSPTLATAEDDECHRSSGAVGDEDSLEYLIDGFLVDRECYMDRFYIHGWRWHKMSIIREAGRLHQLAKRTNVELTMPLQQATDYVVDFNLKGLERVESELFFPWARSRLTSIKEQPDISRAFRKIMDDLERERRKIVNIGDSIKQSVNIACDESKPLPVRSQAIEMVADGTASLMGCVRSMMEKENSLLVPAIAQVVPESEQRSFNNKVLVTLGILDSRLHLVGFREAVWESNISKEKELFEKLIPSFARAMIPRWKRNLYEPRAKALELEF